jgi:hypothetical protein
VGPGFGANDEKGTFAAVIERIAVDRASAPQARIDRPVDKRRASHPLPQAAFKLASFLRQSRLAQALVQPVPIFDIARIGVLIDPLSLRRLPL